MWTEWIKKKKVEQDKRIMNAYYLLLKWHLSEEELEINSTFYSS